MELNNASESKGTEVIGAENIETFSSLKTGEIIAVNNGLIVAERIKIYSNVLSDWIKKHLTLKISEDRKSREEFVLINKTPIKKGDIDIDESIENIKESRK